MVTAKQVYDYLDSVMPFDNQDGWDNSGLLINSAKGTDKILCCLDVTDKAVDTAIEKGCGIIVSHHPVIFSGIKKLDGSSVLYKLIKNEISVISAHTNFDKYQLGTSYKLMQLCDVEGLAQQNEYCFTVRLDKEIAFDEFAANVRKNTKNNIQLVKSSDNITKLFVVAGSGKGMNDEIIDAGCDCVVTGELSYHDMLDLSQAGVSCVCLGHDESEKISVQTLADIIGEKFTDTETVCYIADSLVKYI